ncbi:unnamed protein product, partial [Scytosiphon promiscuus]
HYEIIAPTFRVVGAPGVTGNGGGVADGGGGAGGGGDTSEEDTDDEAFDRRHTEHLARMKAKIEAAR